MKKVSILFCLVLVCFAGSLVAQESTDDVSSNKIGISASIQDGQFGIMIPIWTAEKLAIVPAFEVKYAQNVGFDLGIAVAPRFYFKRDELSPYFGLRLGALINLPSDNNVVPKRNTVDILAGLAFGGEYFFSDHFSVGVEAQGNITKSNKYSTRFGNPDGVNFNTATMIAATIYF